VRDLATPVRPSPQPADQIDVEPKLGRSGPLAVSNDEIADAFEPFGRFQLKLFGSRPERDHTPSA